MVRSCLVWLMLCTSLLATSCFRSPDEPEELRPSAEGARVLPHWEVAYQSREVRAMAMRPDGGEGWAAGEGGIIFHYNGKSWKEDKEASSLTESDLQSIWLSADGVSGWIAGVGAVLRLRKGKWEKSSALEQDFLPPNFFRRSVFISAGRDGANPCVVNSSSSWPTDVQCLAGGIFRRAAFSDKSLSITAVVWASSPQPAWAFSQGVNSVIAQRFDHGDWLAPIRIDLPEGSAQSVVTDAWMSSDQTDGWAVGDGGLLLRYQAGRWDRAPESGTLTQEDLREVVMTEAGSKGWAAGSLGTVLAFDGRSWRIAVGPGTLAGDPFSVIWLQEDGLRGWAFDRRGRAFMLEDGTWTLRSGNLSLTLAKLGPVWCDNRSSAWLHGRRDEVVEILRYERDWKVIKIIPEPPGKLLALSRDGSVGWATSGKKLLNYEEGKKAWRPWSGTDPLAGSHLVETETLALSPDGASGLLLRTDGKLYRFRNGDWKLDAEAGARLGEVENLWLMEGTLTGWASGDSNRPLFLKDGVWTGELSSLAEPDIVLVQVFSSTDGEESMGFNEAGKAFRFSRGTWSVDPEFPKEDARREVSAMWIGRNQGLSLMVFDLRNVWALVEGRWLKDRQASGLVPGNSLYSVCLTPDGESGWAVGEEGTILQYIPRKIQSAQLLPEKGASLEKLRGSHILSFHWDVQKNELPAVSLISGKGTETTPRYEVHPVDGSSRKFRLSFDEAAEEFAKSQEGKSHYIRVKARLAHASLPVTAILESRPFPLHGLNVWQKTLVGALGVIGLNLLLFVSATRVRWLRTIVLHPVGAAALGLIVGKFLLTDLLIRFVHPLKLAMFRDYRRRLAQESPLAEWNGRTYIPPQVSLKEEAATNDEGGESAWKDVFQEILRQPRRRLWLVLGQSGLGKTALLEQWARLALEFGQTPLLIRLRTEQPPESEAAAIMEQYGDVKVTPEVARDLLTGGGFVLLLDGYNEDRSPEATRLFVRQVAQRNLVVLTSQFDPEWNSMLDIRQVYLKPFGRNQLCKILEAIWVEKVVESPYLTEIARLPFTARLLAGYIRRNESLPRTELDIYEDLRTGLDPGLLLNLEEAAWAAFKAHEVELSAGPKLPAEFCDAAVTQGILTRRAREGKQSYRFVHERIHRLLVANYLERQDECPLEDWYKEVTPGLGRGYWIDVLDFRGQIKGRLALLGGAAECRAYRLFLRQAAVFSRPIFTQRLYLQYDRLCRTFPELDDPDFVHWAARVLAGADPTEE